MGFFFLVAFFDFVGLFCLVHAFFAADERRTHVSNVFCLLPFSFLFFEWAFVACFHCLGLVFLPIPSIKLMFCFDFVWFIGLFTISSQLFRIYVYMD